MSSYSGIPYGFYLDTSVGRCSIDSIRIKFSYKFSTYSWSKKCAVPSVDYISDLLDLYDIFAKYPTADVSWAYRDFFRIGSYCRTACISGIGWSCAVLVGRYCYDSSCKLVAPEAVFDFNPNKVPFDVSSRIVSLLRGLAVEVKVIRYDVAFDIPIQRDDVILVRQDLRYSYRLFLDRGGKTEYLGARSSHGSFKLYDKTAESDLSVPVTRAEITVEAASFSSVRDIFPSLYSFSGYQLDTSFSDLPFQVQACIFHPELISVLRSTCSPNTYRKYLSQINSLSQCVLIPDDFKAIDSFVISALLKYISGVML